MTPIKTTVQEAVNTVKKWISIKEYDKALQGLDEILEFEPANEEAKKLRDIAQTQSAATPAPAATPITTTLPAAAIIPTVPAAPVPIEKPAERIHRKISPIALIAVIAVLMISGGVGYMGSKYLKSGEIQEPPATIGSVITPAETQAETPTETALETLTPQTETPAETFGETGEPQDEAPVPQDATSAPQDATSAPQDEAPAPEKDAAKVEIPSSQDFTTEPTQTKTENRSPLKFLLDAFGLTKTPVIENVSQEDMLQETPETSMEQFSEQPQRIKVKRR